MMSWYKRIAVEWVFRDFPLALDDGRRRKQVNLVVQMRFGVDCIHHDVRLG